MVSVIVSVYNAEKTLSACLQSILNQTYQGFELLLIDDGSKDHSGQMCDEWQETFSEQGLRCKVIHQENGGVSKARNCGMEHAEGEFFVCVDSDDMIEPCHLEDLIRTAETHPEFGHVRCGFKCMSNGDRYILTDREPLTTVTRKDYMLLSGKILINSPWLALYRTDIVREYNIKMREDLSLAEDLIFNLEYLDAIGEVPIGILNKTNYIYRDDDPNSLNRKYRSDLRFIYETVDQVLNQYLKKWGITDPDSWQDYYGMVFYHYQKIMENTFHKQNPDSMKSKIEYNNDILKLEIFKEALQKGRIVVTPAQKRALESGDYRRVLLVQRAQEMKQKAARWLK